jgi:plasmid maintenance system antidote protein VapI
VTTAHTPSRNCYLRGCRQAGCIEASTRYTKRLRLEHQRGQYRMTDAAQTRHHIERLMAANWTQRQIAQASGVEAASIHQLYVGAQQKTATWRAAAILAIEITPPPADPHHVDATGTRRRLQALRVIGHRRYDLAAALGITADRVKHITNGNTRRVTTAEATAIARLYRNLSAVPGPSKQTASIARNKGWHSPLAWDDIDNPNCQPEQAAPYRPADMYKRDPDRTREIEHLYLLGESPQQIAKQLGGNEKYIGDQLQVILRERAQRAEQEKAAKAGLEAAA